ncbi:glycosyltransferase family 2 protein [Crenobacter intestini]|uniref:Glycosyltransferase family 2 protein n=1 Tax=Crenobacter intestini TaxID=2563443 RepID=A0A4T0UJ01_9NEIS|nr:glycosyltransferase family A protein [Crenobacter intestini]TIC78508.1 glycosyltransferase family 2 protein [Crenobacter intestini]
MTEQVQKVLVTVVIPTKNGGLHLDRVLSSVYSQQTPWKFEVLVVDSGSTDETLSIVRRYSQLRLIQIEPAEFGHGKTRNLAVAASKGEYVAMITQDALPASPSWLAELLKPMLADDRVAGVFGRHIAYPESSVFTKYELEQHFASFTRYPVIELDDRQRYASDEGYRQLLYFFSDNNALLRRAVWEQIPYPEVDFAEDQAWARKMLEAGYRKAYAHDATVYHSHEYGLWERLQRSFDESYALHRLFGYKQGRGLKHAVRNWMGLTRRDLSIAKRAGLPFSRQAMLLRVPIDNAMRIAGSYLGLHGSRLPEFLRLRLSRDWRLMKIDNWSK